MEQPNEHDTATSDNVELRNDATVASLKVGDVVRRVRDDELWTIHKIYKNGYARIVSSNLGHKPMKHLVGFGRPSMRRTCSFVRGVIRS